MPRRNHRKRAFLFLAAVLLPSAVLVGTTVRLIRQQRELAVRRTQEERALLALRVGQELLEELRRLGDGVVGVSLTPPDIRALTDSEPAILTLALAENGKLVFPWEMHPDPSSALDPASLTRYTRLLDRGEEAEYRAEDLVEAARLYGQAAEVFGEESSQAAGILLAEARVHQARALLRAERMEEARAVYLLLSETPSFLADMDGMPFSVYGLEGLHRTGATVEDLLPLLEETLDSLPHSSTPGLLAWRDVVQEITGTDGAEVANDMLRAVEAAVARRMATLEELENLRTDVPGLLATTRGGRESGGTAGGPSWIPYGREPWLVGIYADGEGAPARVAVVHPALLLGSARSYPEAEAGTAAIEAGDEEIREALAEMTFLPAGDAGGESLGSALNGLRVFFPPGIPSPVGEGEVEGWFFRLLLPVILILTGFTAYLAWRDVRRETEAVRLRSQFVPRDQCALFANGRIAKTEAGWLDALTVET